MPDGTQDQSIDHLETLEKLSSVHEAETVDETVEAVADFALQSLGCTAAAILLGTTPSRLELAAAADTDAIVELADSGVAGPIRDAFESTAAVIVPDVSRETRWPGWPAGDTHGLCSLLVVRLKIAGRPAGVLVVGHTEPDAFGEDEEAIAHIIARHASIAVAGARQQATMAQAVDARKLVGQAMGILMERYDIDADRAFAILRRYSQDTNTKLRTIALELIETRTLPQLKSGDDTAASADSEPAGAGPAAG
jgi:GAF domain-containing protein